METLKVRLSLFAAVGLLLAGCMAIPSGGNRRGQQAPAEAVDTEKKDPVKEKEDGVILDEDKKDDFCPVPHL